jgi:4-carboxymuconolactone decarboxylase
VGGAQGDGAGNDDDDRYERGMATYLEVYGADAVVFERGTAPFFDVMIEQLFAEVWTRPALSKAQRRLITMSVTAARGRFDTLRIQFERALLDGELTAEQVREFVLFVVPYVGYPFSGELHATAEAAITAVTARER